eukprot:c43042_g1_i1 orf=204-1259(+)
MAFFSLWSPATRSLHVVAVTMDPVAPQSPRTVKPDYVFVVNRNGANGRTGREWKNLFPKLSPRLGKDWNLCEAFTSGPMDAVEITREAVRNGAAAVVAVGGDGTLHQVVNGFFEDGKPVEQRVVGRSRTALGLIPLGTGSDFARTFKWSNVLCQAMEHVAKGQRRKIDIGCITIGKNNGQHFFVNIADLHLSAKAGYHAACYKRFGNLCYVIGTLQAFMGHQNQDMDIRMDGGQWRRFSNVTSIAIGNGKYFGGGMMIVPTADPSSGAMEMVILQDFKWHDFITKMPKLYKGTHLTVKNVSCVRAHVIEIRKANNNGNLSKNEIYVQADGEHVGFLPATFTTLPGAIDFLV